jgi:hypothetical protein
MATTGLIRVCPDCKGELPATVPQFCPHCGTQTAYVKERRKKHVHVGRFSLSSSIYDQYEKAVETANLENKDGDRSKVDGEIQNLKTELRNTYRQLPPETARLLMIDTLGIVKNSLHSNMLPHERMYLIRVGKLIGEIAKAAESFATLVGTDPE